MPQLVGVPHLGGGTISEAAIDAKVASAVAADPTVAANTAAVARVDPGTTGTAAQQLRVTVSGPRWLPPDTVSPLLFGGVGDGTTDDYAAIMQAVDQGKPILLGGKRYRSNSTLNLSGGVIIDGGGMGSVSGIGKRGEIQFPLDIDGIVITNTGGNSPVIRDLTISTTHAVAIPTAGDGTGLTITAQAARLDNVYVHGFRKDGIFVAGGSAPYTGINSNLGVATNVKSYYNGRHGIHMFGSDANAWAWMVPNVGSNGGYGIYNDALYHNAFYSAHAISNTLGDYYDDGWGSKWENPYAESNGAFVFGPNARGVRVDMGGIITSAHYKPGGAPSIRWTNGTSLYEYGVDGLAFSELYNQKCQVYANGVPLSDQRWITPNGTEYRWRMDGLAAGSLELRNSSDGISLISIGRASGAGSLGFFGKAPTTRAAANPNTSGATLVDLETEVNELKQLLRDYGLLAT